MDLVNRVLYEIQQEYFHWANNAGHGRPAVVPDFSAVKNKVLTYRAESLSALPAHWYGLLEAPQRPNSKSPAAAGRTPRQLTGGVATVYTNADRSLVTRFKDSAFNTIGAMMAGHDVTIPKHGSEEVCLSWACKAQCSANCKRAAAHKKYSRSTNEAIHRLLDDCGVPPLQE
jgi:hypothetical protein